MAAVPEGAVPTSPIGAVTMTMQELPARPARAWTMLIIVTLGLGLNLRASILIGPHLHERFDVGPWQYGILIGLPLLVAALVRLPVGVLTDRYGARVTMPAVTLASAASVAGLGLSGSLPAAAVAGAMSGVAGAAFVVGAALVARTLPYGRRGLGLGLFGLGVVVAAGVSGVSWGFDPEGRQAAFVLAAIMAGYAGLAAVALRDPFPRGSQKSLVRQCAAMIRLASSSSLSLLYLLALGGIVSIAVYLPLFLTTAVGIEWFHALTITAVVVGLASAGRLAGGWWNDRRPTARLVLICYGVAAALCLAGALLPRVWWLLAPVIAGIAVCDGIACGALLALIGKAAGPHVAGAVMGVTGSVGALGALVPPALVAGAVGLTRSDAGAWILLAALLLAAAVYVGTHGLSVGLGLAVRSEPVPGPTTMTIALVGEPDTRLGGPAVVARLAELATNDELLVVYGAAEGESRVGAGAMAAGLRGRLPRHSVVAVPVGQDSAELGQDALMLSEYVDAGTLAIAVTPAAGMRDVAADLSIYLQADRVVMMSFTPADGAELHQV
ncbi:MFS transporter [Actinoplanes sp. NPDC051633]|uniref:MFS transporter n=1 Tax=Actinoplanes sp. NPDC051633 TaxID=3155670 RepID=UPI003427FBF1